MNKIIRWPLILAAAVLASIGGYALYQAQQDNYPTTGPLRPVFQLPDVNGVEHDIREWDGKVLVINFWATWCPPCLKEIPEFIELQKSLGGKGLQFIGVAIDTPDKVKAFIEKHGINYPILVSQEKGTLVTTDYGNDLGVLPYTAFINRAGQITYTHAGALDKETTKNFILPLL
ncbi:Redoxin domain protein [Nitrosococcus halophilus Nc 4]|uniref:Redoxin domain protein n=1 Tax=Nitrosococcus halophilus (strain Nc4) TaxID=472759 RepID=D5C1Z3_NITHN|nr:TlpA disulfide reductase family protein [Nitrosococcus halophilus]ADE16581.1 Redoxin domain protein [Nitrosococcus halophilus Nc 4]